VYSVIYFYSKEKKRTLNKTGELIGYITEKGEYIKSKKTQLKSDKIKAQKPADNDHTGVGEKIDKILDDQQQIKEYGQYSIILENGKELLDDLKKVYEGKIANTIFVIAAINLAKGLSNLKNYKQLYDGSYYSLVLQNISGISKNLTPDFLDLIGRNVTKRIKFSQVLMGKNNTKNYAIDGHVIKNKSALNSLANYGNKFEKINSKQIVSMTMIGLESMLPVYTSVFNGAQLDKQAINEFIDLENFQDYLFVIDCGFYSEENIKSLETKNKYIIPLSSNLKTYKDVIAKQNLEGNFSFTISKNKKKENILIKYQKISFDNKNIYIFKDIIKAAGEEADWIKNGASEEKLIEIRKTSGIIILQTNLNEKDPSEVFELYKKR
jgi:hypothetical protein